MTCASVPWTVIPLVVTDVQSFIAAGQVRTGEQLIDAAKTGAPGTLTVFLQPLFEGGIDRVTPGSSCIANAYTNNHDRLSGPDIGFWKWLGLHVVDTVSDEDVWPSVRSEMFGSRAMTESDGVVLIEAPERPMSWAHSD